MALFGRGLRLSCLLALAAGLPEEDVAAPEVLPADEQCESLGGGVSCGLSLRQLRRLQVHKTEVLEEPTWGMRPFGGSVNADAGTQPLAKFGGTLPTNGTRLAATTDDDQAVSEGPLLNDTAPAAPPVPKWTPWDPELEEPSGGDLFNFYMYRAISDEVYAPININAASLGGVLWYLHHEVVIQYPRKFAITKIVRFQVQVRAPKPLLRLSMNFGPRMAFDKGQCTGPHICGRFDGNGTRPRPKFCDTAFDVKFQDKVLAHSGKPYNTSYEYSRFGFHVGCNRLGDYPFPMFKVYYPDAMWYSLPGPCPSKVWNDRTNECVVEEPGGLCPGTPTGQGNCTWNYEYMGEVMVDDLVGESAKSIHKRGAREYDPISDKGFMFSFWNGMNDTKANAARMKALQDLFALKYPNQTLDEDMPTPPCDFNFGTFYKEFWFKDPFTGKCRDETATSPCGQAIKWAMKDGINQHPEWFVGLTPGKSTFKDFQRWLYVQNKVECPYRPCDPKDFIVVNTTNATGNAMGNATGNGTANSSTNGTANSSLPSDVPRAVSAEGPRSASSEGPRAASSEGARASTTAAARTASSEGTRVATSDGLHSPSTAAPRSASGDVPHVATTSRAPLSNGTSRPRGFTRRGSTTATTSPSPRADSI